MTKNHIIDIRIRRSFCFSMSLFLVLALVCFINVVHAQNYVGSNVIGTTSTQIYQNQIVAFKFQSQYTFTATKMKCHIIQRQDDRIRLAIYSDNNNKPGTLLGYTNDTLRPTLGWCSYTLTSGVSIVSGTNYWLAQWAYTGHKIRINTNSGTAIYLDATYASTFPAGSAYSGTPATSTGSIYAESATGTAVFPAVAVLPVRITTPLTRAIYQRSAANTASVPIVGTYTGSPTSIQAQAVVATGGNGTAVGWTTISSSPNGGAFSGSLTLQAGGWYTIQVRSMNGQTTLATDSVLKVGVGEVFVTAGQSNSCNFGQDKLTPNTDKVSAWDPITQAWVFAQDPQPSYLGFSFGPGVGGSPWSALGETLVTALNVPVGFITLGEGACSIQSWTTNDDWYSLVGYAGSGNLYDRMKAIVQRWGVNGFRSVLWHQGESDAMNGTDSATYRTKLTSIITASRTDAGWQIPWGIAIAAYHSDPSATPARVAIINKAQLATCNSTTIYEGAHTDNMLVGYRANDGVHFKEAGLREHAERWKVVLMNKFFNATPVKKNNLMPAKSRPFLQGSAKLYDIHGAYVKTTSIQHNHINSSTNLSRGLYLAKQGATNPRIVASF